MPEIILPVTKKIFVCDDVIRDPLSGNTSLINFWDTVHAQGKPFPFQRDALCVFARFRGGFGSIKINVQIIQAASGDPIRPPSSFPVVFSDRTKTYDVKFKIQNVLFPTPGMYVVELFCNNEFVDDQAIRVTP